MNSRIQMLHSFIFEPINVGAVTSSGGTPVQTSIIEPPFFSVLSIQLSYFSQHRNH